MIMILCSDIQGCPDWQ